MHTNILTVVRPVDGALTVSSSASSELWGQWEVKLTSTDLASRRASSRLGALGELSFLCGRVEEDELRDGV